MTKETNPSLASVIIAIQYFYEYQYIDVLNLIGEYCDPFDESFAINASGNLNSFISILLRQLTLLKPNYSYYDNGLVCFNLDSVFYAENGYHHGLEEYTDNVRFAIANLH